MPCGGSQCKSGLRSCRLRFKAPATWGEHYAAVRQTRPNGISFTHLRRGGTCRSFCRRRICCPHFNPPTPCGVGPLLGKVDHDPAIFQSTHPVRGGTHPRCRGEALHRNFNPPTPCGVGLLQNGDFHLPKMISIHPPRAGWDGVQPKRVYRFDDFNPPTPCGVGRRGHRPQRGTSQFQSTHPVRGGTSNFSLLFVVEIFQSTHPVRGGTCHSRCPSGCSRFQSTHPVRGGTKLSKTRMATRQFQSTHPVRGGTLKYFRICNHAAIISIHPPRAGWDVFLAQEPPALCAISIHPPRAGWDSPRLIKLNKTRISIHPPRAGWDAINEQSSCPGRISIHPPRAGWDSKHTQKSLRLFARSSKIVRMIRPQRSAFSQNRPAFGCFLLCFFARTSWGIHDSFRFAELRRSESPPRRRSLLRRNARFWSGNGCPGNKTAGCLSSRP